MKFANKSPCILPPSSGKSGRGEGALFPVATLLPGVEVIPFPETSFFSTRSMSVLNSSSSKMLRSESSSASSRTRESISSWMGTSILIVARNFEKVIISRFVSTFVFSAPFSWSVCSNKFSMLPNSEISFWAVFSPTPGHPGILSEESPISPSMSITCAGDWMSNLAFTSSTPITSKPPVCLGRYINTLSLTNCP